MLSITSRTHTHTHTMHERTQYHTVMRPASAFTWLATLVCMSATAQRCYASEGFRAHKLLTSPSLHPKGTHSCMARLAFGQGMDPTGLGRNPVAPFVRNERLLQLRGVCPPRRTREPRCVSGLECRAFGSERLGRAAGKAIAHSLLAFVIAVSPAAPTFCEGAAGLHSDAVDRGQSTAVSTVSALLIFFIHS
jgi:hypothetical protein